ncbi:MAG TPA: transglycosylase family protein [Acidimicrobiia bacterium]
MSEARRQRRVGTATIVSILMAGTLLCRPAEAQARPRPSALSASVARRLRQCESGGRYRLASGNGRYGAYQFSATTWKSLGLPGLPHHAPPRVQDGAARRLLARDGWRQWPACSRRLGLRC